MLYFVQEKVKTEQLLEQWRAAYQKRLMQNNIPVPFTACQYDMFADVEESNTLEYLDSLTDDLEKIFLQSLLIQQRILGTNNVDLQRTSKRTQ